MTKSSAGAEVLVSNNWTSDKHDLLTIPIEVFELIAAHVKPPDLLRLRLVSRETSQRTQKPFVKAFFSRRAFLLSNEDSLRELLTIAEDDRYVRGLKTIDLCIENIQDPRDFVEDAEGEIRPDNGLLMSRDRLESRMHQKEWNALFETQERYRKQNVDLHLLTVLFSRLRRLDQSRIEVRVVDRSEAWDKPIGAENLEWLCKGQLGLPLDFERLISTVLEAIALSALPLDSFVARCKSWDWRFTDIIEVPSSMTNAREVFRTLRKLHLLVDSADEEVLDVYKASWEVIASAQLVEDLSVQTWSYDGYFYIIPDHKEILSALCDCLCRNFPALKVLDLQGFCLSRAQLEEIVAHHPKLERLHFHSDESHCVYPDGGFGIYPYITVDNYTPTSVLETIPEAAEFKDIVAAFKDMLVAPCTICELQKGKGYWNESYKESKRSWSESAYTLWPTDEVQS